MLASVAALPVPAARADGGVLTFTGSLGAPGVGPGELTLPGGIASDGQGRIWVADSGNDRIQVFDDTGHLLFTSGEHGSGHGTDPLRLLERRTPISSS
jgi:hypothetical protein